MAEKYVPPKSAYLSAKTKILLSDYTEKSIEEIVEGHLELDVLSYNISTEEIESKDIIGWSKYKSAKDVDYIYKYNLIVEDNYNLFANDILVRNY